MPKRSTSFRLPDLSRRQLDALIEMTGMTMTEVVTMALDRMYNQEWPHTLRFSRGPLSASRPLPADPAHPTQVAPASDE